MNPATSWPCGCPIRPDIVIDANGRGRWCPICGACLECGKKHVNGYAFFVGSMAMAFIFLVFIACEWIRFT